jgi:hypothetical protein
MPNRVCPILWDTLNTATKVPFFSLIFANADLSKLSYGDNNNNFFEY